MCLSLTGGKRRISSEVGMYTAGDPTCIMVHEEQMSQFMGHDGGLDVDVGVHADDGRTGFLAQLASVR